MSKKKLREWEIPMNLSDEGGEVWVNELGDYNEVEGRKIAKAENEWYKESDQSELTAKYENGKVNVYLNESLAEDYAKEKKLYGMTTKDKLDNTAKPKQR